MYFFDQEIRADIARDIASQDTSQPRDIYHAEYAALLARSASGLEHQDYVSLDVLTLLVNDYLFAEGEFLDKDYAQADQILADALHDECKERNIAMTDALLELRRARADVTLARELDEGIHSYQSLSKRVGDYIGTFGTLPRFAAYFDEWSPGVLDALLKDPSKCKELLEPRYELALARIDDQALQAYGSLDIVRTDYTHGLARLGVWWISQPRYLKLMMSIGIVFVSVLRGGRSLWILPLLW